MIGAQIGWGYGVIDMGTYLRCPACRGNGKVHHGILFYDCRTCKGTGAIELPVEEVYTMLKWRFITFLKRREVRKALEQSFKNMSRYSR
jgi:hypothetical protein